jgi:hypothetical protein
MLKKYWAIDEVSAGEPQFARPVRTRKQVRGVAVDEWELVAFGRRLYVSVKRR